LEDEMEWTEIDYMGDDVEARDFLDGILVRDSLLNSSIFVPGWRIEQQRGDMDGPNFRKLEKRFPVYALELREKE
jgi:hypothetical protein